MLWQSTRPSAAERHRPPRQAPEPQIERATGTGMRLLTRGHYVAPRGETSLLSPTHVRAWPSSSGSASAAPDEVADEIDIQRGYPALLAQPSGLPALSAHL